MINFLWNFGYDFYSAGSDLGDRLVYDLSRRVDMVAKNGIVGGGGGDHCVS